MARQTDKHFRIYNISTKVGIFSYLVLMFHTDTSTRRNQPDENYERQEVKIGSQRLEVRGILHESTFQD